MRESPRQSYREFAVCNETQNERILRRIKMVCGNERAIRNFEPQDRKALRVVSKGLSTDLIDN